RHRGPRCSRLRAPRSDNGTPDAQTIRMTAARALVVVLLLLVSAVDGTPAQAPPPALVAVPAAPAVVAEVSGLVETARQRFEARDAGGVLAFVSEQYRSGGLTKSAVRQQLLAMLGLY